MTIQKTSAELRRFAMIKALRSMIRLRFSLLADAELNRVLPEAEKAFDKALQRGELPDAIDIEAIARAAVPE
jgi:hypothetical protein